MAIAQDLSQALTTLLREVLEGPSASGAFVLNRTDKGLLASLDALSADAASFRRDNQSSVAAHVDHLRYGLELLNQWARGADPWSTANYAMSWQRDLVTDEQWKTLRHALRGEAHAWITAAGRRTEWNEQAMTEVIASVVHLAYHLGAIRQIAPATRGPRASE